jgi:hypothetical protein
VGRRSRWLVFLPVAFLALLPQQANAEPELGLNAVGYLIDQIPPERSDTIYPTCGSEVENNINRNFNGEPFQDCGWDFFMVHYTGFINLPEHETIEFMVAADDGGTVSIAGQEFGTWDLKGCSWSSTITLSVMPGLYPLDGWFFEAGGGTCYMLAWKIDDAYWEIVPEWAFTTASTPVTTTSTSTVPPETVPVTDPPTTTTLQETSTTEEPTTSSSSTQPTLPATTTLPPAEEQTQSPPTGTSTSTTTPSTSTPPSTVAEPSTTVTTEPETTTSSSTVDTSPPATSPTPQEVAPPPVEAPAPATTVQEELPQEEPQPPVTDPEVPETQTSVDTLPPFDDGVVEDPQEPAVDAPIKDAPTIDAEPPVSSVDESEPPVSTIDTPETLLEALDASSEPTPAQAAQLATNPQVLAVASVEQAEAIFEALNVSELDNTQIAALIEAVQDAPAEVREAFEDTIDIFGEGLDDYVPLGSNIPVGTRRTLIAVTAGITLAAAGTRIRR